MTVLSLCLFGLGLGRSPYEVGAIAAVWIAPIPTAAVLLVLVARSYRRSQGEARPKPVMVLIRVVSELQSGATLRGALVSVMGGDPDYVAVVRLAAAGRPMSEVGTELERSFGRYGRLTGAAIRLSARLGGSTGQVFEQLAVHMLAIDDVARERRAAAAPAVLQAVVVGGAPAVGLALMLVSGRWLALMAAGGVSTVLVGLGTVFLLVGIVWVCLLVWRSVT